MKPKNFLFYIRKFILSLLYIHCERKPSTLRAYVFTVEKKLQQKISQLNALILLYMINILKMVSP